MVEITEAIFLTNRNQQIWEPLLAIAKVTGDFWYQRALAAARTFTASEETVNTVGHIILKNSYRVFRSGEYPDRIHSVDLLEALRSLGIPKWVELNHLSDYLSDYDPEIKPRQMKIDRINRNGYEWHTFLKSFKTYISEKKVRDIEQDLGISPPVDEVDVVDASRDTHAVDLFHGRPRETSLLSTGSTYPTF
jgi:hypothetical protein